MFRTGVKWENATWFIREIDSHASLYQDSNVFISKLWKSKGTLVMMETV